MLYYLCVSVSPSDQGGGIDCASWECWGWGDYGCPGCLLISGNVKCLGLMAYGACCGGLDRMYGLDLEQYGFLKATKIVMVCIKGGVQF